MPGTRTKIYTSRDIAPRPASIPPFLFSDSSPDCQVPTRSSELRTHFPDSFAVSEGSD